ncbi:MAG: hypothetical protein V3S64_09960 [bacterium]
MIARIFFFLTAALMTWSTAGLAQVAAPSLRPGALNTVSFNPAVLQWRKSAVTIGKLEGTNEIFDAAGTKLREDSFDGPFYQGVGVGEYFSIGAEKFTLDGSSSDPAATYLSNYDQTQAALAGNIGDVVALGVGVDNTTLDFSNNRQQVNEITIAGVSLRLGEVFYLGLAVGDEMERREFGVGVREATRSITRMGAAYLWQGDESAIRASIFSEERDALTFQLNPGVYNVRGEIEERSWSIGGIYSNILVEYIFRDITLRNETNAFERSEERRAFNLGWVPREGLAIVLRFEERDLADQPTGVTHDRSRRRITVSWQF